MDTGSSASAAAVVTVDSKSTPEKNVVTDVATSKDDVDDDDFDCFGGDDDDEFGDAAIQAAVSQSSAGATLPTATASTANLDSDDEDLFREIEEFL